MIYRNPHRRRISGSDTAPIDLFTAYCKSELNVDMVREYRFHGTRKWRFDYAVPALKIAVKCDGGVWGYGRHNRPQGEVQRRRRDGMGGAELHSPAADDPRHHRHPARNHRQTGGGDGEDGHTRTIKPLTTNNK